MFYGTIVSLSSVNYPTNVLCDATHIKYINSCMFRHRGAIFWEVLQEGVQANLPVHVLFIFINVIKTLVC